MTSTSAPVHKPPPAQMTSTSVPLNKPPPARKASTTAPLTQPPPAQAAPSSAPLHLAPPAQMMSTPAPSDQSPSPQRTGISVPLGQPSPAPTASTSAPLEQLPPAQTVSIAAPLDQTPEQTTSTLAPLGQLPPDWDEVYDPDTNRPFFVKSGGHVQWRDPRSGPPPPPLPPAPVVQPHRSTPAPLGQLPPGWDEVYDKVTEQPFFINNSSGHVQWRHPRQAPPPPPPLPPGCVVQPHGLPSMNETKRKRDEEHVQGPPIPLGPRGDGPESSTASLAVRAPTTAAPVPPSVNVSCPTMPLAMRNSSSRTFAV
ncbi:unnamed protein product [Cercospora beticola]|nr:unnamed protein product [Cercospora beticola]